MSLLIFTDLDGTLLDHGSLSCEEARPALDRIRESGIPLVMVTSKTRGEVEEIQTFLNLDEPFVIENGGGVYFPPLYHHLFLPEAVTLGRYLVLRLGDSYQRIRAFMASLPEELSIRGFGDLSLAELQAATGLPPETASMARAREFTETLLPVEGEQFGALEDRAARAGLEVVRGGRFIHLVGAGQSKGRAVERLIRAFRESWDPELLTVGLGDSLNDLPMLAAVDVPILVPNPQGSAPDLHWDRLTWAPYPGSRGWNATVLGLLEHHRIKALDMGQG